MIYLAIETSCDETSIALLHQKVHSDQGDFVSYINSIQVLGQIVSSQIQTHAQYGGVVPEVGARLHANQIHFLLDNVLVQVLDKFKSTEDEAELFGLEHLNITDKNTLLAKIDTIFVTTEPGLPSALKVGVEFARTLTFFINHELGGRIKLQTVNHLRGHIASSYYQFA